ncbi:MAG: argininosuccinate lyase [Proteobacteria bacterium]|nr:argininosuccinate lyase [Pseudomonadota bacterium]NCA28571.1 argininosuccinate lyase [Pseudomonadota bacterium]
MWGGRFEEKPSSLMQQINQSISFDKKLYRQDISGSIAHAKMLAKVKIINESEKNKIVKGLQQIKNEIESAKFNFSIELEDIHLNIESRLKEIIGDCAGKLHTARSRNDQVAVDLRLFIRENIDEILLLLHDLQKNLVKKSSENLTTIIPGFTHLQVAQPVLFSHHLMAYFEMFKRDSSRLRDLRNRMNECPLGACALAGTSYPIDRNFVAKELGFDRPTANSMDSVSDRDFVIEFLFCLNLIANHLSRLSEEIILWMSRGFQFIKLSDRFTSGSSIMPQKKNPDGAELIRGKTGRITGALVALLTTMKALSLTYSKDMQEDKEPLFDALENSKICIELMTKMIDDFVVNKDKMYQMASCDYSCATDIADWLVKNLKIPFRQSHHITGSIVKMAEEKGLELHQLKLSDMQKIEKEITQDIFNFLDPLKSINSRKSYGGTASSEVKKQIENAQKYLKAN